jgi:hypothetical protein
VVTNLIRVEVIRNHEDTGCCVVGEGGCCQHSLEALRDRNVGECGDVFLAIRVGRGCELVPEADGEFAFVQLVLYVGV